MSTKTILRYSKCATTLTRGFKIFFPLHQPLVPFKLSDIGEGIREVTVKQSFVKPNQRVSQFEDVLEVESDKAAVTITSRFDGEVKNIYFKEGDIIPVGSVLCDIHIEGDDVETHETPTPVVTEDNIQITVETIQTENALFNDKPLATPAVRRLSRENNVNLSTIKGTGKGGRVLKEDVLLYLNQPTREPVSPVFTAADDVIQPIVGYQKVMIRTMTESNRIPTLGLSDEMDVTELENLRKALKAHPDSDVKLTLLAFIVKAISLAMKMHPILNAVFDEDAIKYQNSHNIGIAVDTSAGLVVPNIKNVQTLSVREIAKEIQRLQELALEGKLSLADTSSGTFTISNIGAIAGTVVKPLILPPQVAIVGIGRIQALPRFNADDQISKRLIINTSWAADHRIIDGATVGRFSNLVKRYLESPGFLALDA